MSPLSLRGGERVADDPLEDRQRLVVFDQRLDVVQFGVGEIAPGREVLLEEFLEFDVVALVLLGCCHVPKQARIFGNLIGAAELSQRPRVVAVAIEELAGVVGLLGLPFRVSASEVGTGGGGEAGLGALGAELVPAPGGCAKLWEDKSATLANTVT